LKTREEVEARLSLLISDSNYKSARELLKQANAEYPHSAFLRYRMAQCLENLDELEEAAQAYSDARDLDPCRYRAPSSFGDTLRQAASESSGGVFFLDLVPVFSRHSKYAAPGSDLFLEHVHFTIDGHWLVAKSIAHKIVEDVCGEDWDESRLPSEKERDDWLGLIPEDHLVASILAFFASQTAPFDEAIDTKKHSALLAEKINQITESLPDQDARVFMSLDNNVKMKDLVDGLGRAWLTLGEHERALEMFKRSTRRRPWMPNGHVFSAICYHLLGKESEALKCLEESRTTVVNETDPLLRDKDKLLREMRRQ